MFPASREIHLQEGGLLLAPPLRLIGDHRHKLCIVLGGVFFPIFGTARVRGIIGVRWVIV